MFCSNCGKEIDNEAVVCPNCGVLTERGKIENNGVVQQTKIDLGLVSIILGACGLFMVWFVTILGAILGVSGITLGILTLVKEKERKNKAIVGIVLSGVTLFIVIASYVLVALVINGYINAIL